MENEEIKYILESVLATVDDKGVSHRNSYALSYIVRPLQEVGQDATFYDRELKMHFEDVSALATVYEIEIGDAFFDLDRQVAKSKDFFTRTLYRYDGMQPRVNRRGKLLSIDNVGQMKEQWKRIRALLLDDYVGDIVNDYIGHVDKEMALDDSSTPLRSYFFYGLLFPAIPQKRLPDWEGRRTVTLSDFDGLSFDEHIAYDGMEDGNRKYSVSGTRVAEEDAYTLSGFNGCILVPDGNIHPAKAQVEVAYTRGGIDVNWNFKLTQISESE